MTERADANETVLMSDRVAQVVFSPGLEEILMRSSEFAADVMTMISFTEPWGFVKNGRDERGILSSWRKGLPLFGFAGRFNSFRKLLGIPGIGEQLLPKATDKDGFGYLMNWADKEVQNREEKLGDGLTMDQPDFLQQ